MKFLACTIALCTLMGVATSAESPAAKGTLVSIVLDGSSSPADNYPDGRPGRVPPGPITYTYKFTVRQGCLEYTGLYDSFKKTLASQFKPGEEVGIRTTKRLLYLKLSGEEENFRMPLSGHHEVANCTPDKKAD